MNLGELTLPRRVFPLLNNSRFVFATANAIYQFAPEYMQVTQMLNTADHPEVDTASILDIQAWDNYTVYLTYLEKHWPYPLRPRTAPTSTRPSRGGRAPPRVRATATWTATGCAPAATRTWSG